MLALSAFVVLGAASVYMGGLNQDEGWYLYAANLVSEGRVPYRDFFFTQGPVLPYVYSVFSGVWRVCGLLGARVFTLIIGGLSIAFTVLLADRLKKRAGIVVFSLLALNLYHLYYLAIPKTYALCALFVSISFYLLSFEGLLTAFVAAFALGLAAGTRISTGAILPVVGIALLLGNFRNWRWAAFGIGGVLSLAIVYGPFLFDASAREGLMAAQAYHAARGGSDLAWTIGSLSRFVRWYLPLVIIFSFSVRKVPIGLSRVMLLAFLVVFIIHMAAPFPYEDYQVPIVGLMAVVAAVEFVEATSNYKHVCFLSLGLAFATSFGSPLLEKWMTNGQDRFWSIKKPATEISELRRVAHQIEALDPKGATLLTQDLYLAIETNRKVPEGLEMGPFAMLDDEAWRRLLVSAHERYPIAALSGYTFAIEPPSCRERDVARQLEYWRILEASYQQVAREECFGQNATTLLILKRK